MDACFVLGWMLCYAMLCYAMLCLCLFCSSKRGRTNERQNSPDDEDVLYRILSCRNRSYRTVEQSRCDAFRVVESRFRLRYTLALALALALALIVIIMIMIMMNGGVDNVEE